MNNNSSTTNTTDNSKYSCFTADSIRLMAESASIPENLSVEVAATISEDVTYRLRQIIGRATSFTRHANRTKLTCADINRALKWSDCQPVFGHECNPNERLRYSYSTEAQVFRYEESPVDLERKYGTDSSKTVDQFQSELSSKEALPRLRIETNN